MCANKNRLIEAILMSTHNIHFQTKITALELSQINIVISVVMEKV